MNKAFIGIMVGVVMLMIGVFALGGGKQTTNNVAFEGNPSEVQESDHRQGPTDAAIALIEFADFECPACSNIAPVIAAAKAQFGDDMQLVFRHFPLTNIHPNSNAAHRAAEAAGNQGMFFEMHDLLYQRQSAWSAQGSGLSTTQAISVFEKYAEELGLDMDQYRTDANGNDVFDVITSHQDSGNQLNIQSTPTLMLNGEIIESPADADSFLTLLQNAIDVAKANSSDTPEETTEDNAEEAQ